MNPARDMGLTPADGSIADDGDWRNPAPEKAWA